MKVTVLGYWGAFPWNGEGTSSYLLEADGFKLLIDAGSSTLNVLQEQLDPLTLDGVIISHYHHDHIADLGVLQYYRQLKPKGEPIPELPIYGHTEDPFHYESLTMAGVSQGYPYDPAESLEIGPFLFTFLRTVHPVTCFAMRIEEIKTGSVLVYTADSGYLAAFDEFVKGADVLIADTYLLAGQEKHHAHFTSQEAGLMARQGQVKTLILSHLQQEIDLDLLREQAQTHAGDQVAVILAQTNLSVTI